MPRPEAATRPKGILERRNLALLFNALSRRGFRLIGPTVKDGAIVYAGISSPDDLPIGWTDQQEAGTYRLARRGDAACFGFAAPPQSLRPFLHLPAVELFHAERRPGGAVEITSAADTAQAMAFIGVHACDLAAVGVQDKVFATPPYADPHYQARRAAAFIVGVNCTRAGATCFCASMGTGPRLRGGFDLALTEIIDAARHIFLAEAGSDAGEAVMAELKLHGAGRDDVAAADVLSARAAANMGRRLDTAGIKELLQGNPEHPRWDEVAQRCLACGNCTMVCPTCFCNTIEDSTDLAGTRAARARRWDSCYTLDFSYIHGGSVRTHIPALYRHWLTHKLASWYDQFGVSGCVGCGRCITWCPPGIDLTEEVGAIRASGAGAKEASHGNA